MPNATQPLPSSLSRDDVQNRLDRFKDAWAYAFEFDVGASTAPREPIDGVIHRSRAELVFPWLDRHFAGRWDRVRCLDLACNQGWYAFQLALRGSDEVIGVDVRPEHLDMAETIRAVSGLQRASFRLGNLFELDPQREGRFDLTLFLGILYHLENPVGALRMLRALTRDVCVIETQVAQPAPELRCLWGSAEAPRSGPGMAIVPSDASHREGDIPLVLVPTLDGLLALVKAAGFRNIELMESAPAHHEQYRSQDRVVVIARD